MKSKLTLLGTGTCQLQQHRYASSILLEIDQLKVVYDLGRGIAQRLDQLHFKQDDLEHIVISHFHPDHFLDLIPYLHAGSWSRIDPRKKPLNIYGPKGIKTLINKIINLFKPNELINGYQLKVHEINQTKFKIADQIFNYILLPPANNHGLKFTFNQKTYAITGDSDYHQPEINFLKDVDLAIIDAGHQTEDQIINLAVKSQAKKIICSHQYLEINGEKLTNKAKKLGYKGKFISATDLMSFSL
jgi:ribonuclease BN (tRNA processing enzyme)